MNDKPIVSFMLLYKSYNRIIRHELLMYTQYQHFGTNIHTHRPGKLDTLHRI